MSFPTYAHYKDSGVEWLGEVPAHWDVTKAGRYFSILSGFAFPSSEFTLDESNTRLLRGINVGVSKIRWDETVYWRRFSGDDLDSFELACGDVVIGMDRPYINEGMRVARISDADLPCLLLQRVAAIRAFGKLSDDYIFLLLSSTMFLDHFSPETTGVSVPHISPSQISGFIIPIPPLAEQKEIFKWTQNETTKLDALITEQRTLIDLLKEKRQAVISHAVTKGLDAGVAMKDSGVEWLGEVPAHWDVCSLRRVIRSIEQGWSPECFARQAEGDEWGVLKAGCVNRGIFNQDENKALPVELSPIPEYEVRAGDVLMSRASGSPELVGSTARVQVVQPRLMLSDKIFRIHLNSNATPDYFVLTLNSISLREQIEQALSGGNGMANNLPQSSLLEFMVCFPQVFEQAEICRRIVEKTERLDALTVEAQTTIALLQERRSALISAAVTGKIDVRGRALAEEIPKTT
jgi:type I restriction enzyme S subunit